MKANHGHILATATGLSIGAVANVWAGCLASSNTSDAGGEFLASVLNFIGSPVFYAMMFILALGGLYSAIVKHDVGGLWAVGFAAVGAASPQIFVKISDFFCDIMSGIVN